MPMAKGRSLVSAEIVPFESAYPGYGEFVVQQDTDHVFSCKVRREYQQRRFRGTPGSAPLARGSARRTRRISLPPAARQPRNKEDAAYARTLELLRGVVAAAVQGSGGEGGGS